METCTYKDALDRLDMMNKHFHWMDVWKASSILAVLFDKTKKQTMDDIVKHYEENRP